MSSRVLRRVMIGIASLGLAVTIYLTVVHYAGLTVACTTAHNSCQQVQTSVYSHLLGIPVVDLGLVGYVGLLAALLVPDGEWPRLAALVVTIAGFGFSLYLTYREAFTLHEYCEWCLGSAGVMTVTVILAATRYVAGPSHPPDSPA